MEAGTLPPFIGIRIKPMSEELHGAQPADPRLFVSSLARATKRRFPGELRRHDAEVMTPAHVAAWRARARRSSGGSSCRRGALKLELMIETPQSILATDGSSALRALVARRRRPRPRRPFRHLRLHRALRHHRGVAAHAPPGLRLREAHDAGRARADRRVALGRRHQRDAGRAAPRGAGRPLTERRGARTARPSIAPGSSTSTTCALARERLLPGLGSAPGAAPDALRRASTRSSWRASGATARLRNFVEKAAQATLVGDVFDDAATGQGLLNFFVRGLSSGAMTLDEARETGLTVEELQGRSFLAILAGRKRG